MATTENITVLFTDLVGSNTLGRELFVQAVTGHATSISAVGKVISGHLGDDVAE